MPMVGISANSTLKNLAQDAVVSLTEDSFSPPDKTILSASNAQKRNSENPNKII